MPHIKLLFLTVFVGKNLLGIMRRSTILSALAMLLLVFGNNFAVAQLNLAWDEIGPNNTGNHVRAIAVDGSGHVWAGSVGGGLWKSTDGGSSWSMVTGVSENLAVSCIAVDGNNIYVGTGEAYYFKPESTWLGGTLWAADSLRTLKNGFLKASSQPGEGVFTSNDGGVTWSHDNGTWNGGSVRYSGDFMSIQAVASKGGRTLVASLKGLYWSDNGDLGTVTKSSGTSYFMNNTITEVKFANNNVVYAGTRDSLYRSTDGGQSFGAAINSTVPVGTAAPNNRIAGHRFAIAVAPSNSDVIYLTGANDVTGNCTGVWKSVDNGYTWVSISPYESAIFKPFQNKGLYSMFLGVPPGDANAVFIGGTKMYRYSNVDGWVDAASHSFVPGFSTRFVPLGQLAIAFDPNSDSVMYVGTDHEIVRTDNLGRTYSFKTKGFNNAHLYSISPSPSFKLLASDRFHGISAHDNGATVAGNQQFNSIHSASLTGGGFARWSNILPENFICSKSEDRGLQRSLTQGATFEDFYGFPLDSVNPCWGVAPDSMIIDRSTTTVGGGGIYDRSSAPIMPFCFDEYIPAGNLANDTAILNTPMYLFMATGNFVWMCQNPFGGIDSVPTWNRVSDDLITGTLPGGKKKYFTAITSSNDAGHYTYVATNNGEVFRIVGGHRPESFCVTTDVVRIDGSSLPSRWISDIEVDPTNTNNVIVTFAGFAQGDDRVYITNNAKDVSPVWRSIQGNLEANLPVHSAAFHNDPNNKSILLGTEEGVYATTSDYENGNVSWTFEGGAIGNVPVMDIVIRKWYMEFTDINNYRYSPDNTVFLATYGRGAWKSSTIVSKPEEVVAGSGIKLQAVPNPAVSSTSIKFDLPQATRVTLNAYGIDGRPVAQLTNAQYGAGQNEIEFNTQALPAGVYLVKANFTNAKGNFQSHIRVVVVK
ncbi:MAG: hypothetical protein RLZZ519_1279 [Bacteroidota bacterium]|jgi:hypothetical protein